MRKINPKFSASQKDFYSAALTAWRNFLGYLIAFSDHKGFYKEDTAKTAKDALDAAIKLPDAKQRLEDAETERVKMARLAIDGGDFFIKLKSYINTAFPDVREIKYESAGQQYYRYSQAQDWESVTMLYSSVLSFIEKNNAQLKTGENMPETFEAAVKAKEEAFKKSYDDFKFYSETGVATQDKIEALNACFDTMTDMLKDGKAIFRRDDAKLEMFTYSAILASINPTKASILGLVTDMATDEVINDAIVTVKYENEPEIVLEVNEDGLYNEVLKGGKAVVTISANEYITSSENVEFKKGTTFRHNVKLQKAA